MAIYLAQIFIIFIFSVILHPVKNNQRRKWFFIISFFVLTIVSGIRGYSVGADTKVYVQLYNNINAISINNGRYEAGFIIYLKALHRISKNPSFMLFISSVFLHINIRKNQQSALYYISYLVPISPK